MHEAVWYHDQHLASKQLKKEAENLSRLLQKQGNGPVLLYGHKSLSMVISICACLLAGRTYIPADTCWPAARIRKVHALAKAELIVYCEPLPAGLEDLEQASCEQLDRYKDRESKAERPDAPAYIIFTSGSSGVPKGVPVSRANLKNFIQWITAQEPFAGFRNIRVLNQASFSFDLSVADLFFALTQNHTLCLLDRHDQGDPERLMEQMLAYSPHMMVATPTFIRLCLLCPEFSQVQLPDLECVFLCGEMLDVRTVQKLHTRFENLSVFNAYGPTEACCAVCGVEITAEMCHEKSLPVGRVDNSAVQISIEDNEIVLCGKSVAAGYLQGDAGGFFSKDDIRGYRTGDLGIIQNGLLYCKGRKDRQIKFKGFRIELDEIEQSILQLDGVRGCVVQAVRSKTGVVSSIVAYVETDLEASEVEKRLGQRLPAYLMPRQIRVCAHLPVNCSGKTDRKEMEERDGHLPDVV